MVHEPVGRRPWHSGAEPPLVLAHRGAPGPVRENTTDAFTAALALGADGVELDVRRTKDGVLVVHHDPEVDGVGLLHEQRVGDLPDWLPTLEEALVACAGAVVDVEMKNAPGEPGHDPSGALEAAVAELVSSVLGTPAGPGAALVSSFWPASLQAVSNARPELPTGLLVHPAFAAEEALGWSLEEGVAVLLPFHSQVDAELVERARGRGVAVVAWTVNDRPDLDAVLAKEVAGVVTDRVLEALAARAAAG